MSSSNRESISFIAEVTWGTTPGSPTGQKIEFVDTTIGQTNETTSSNTIRSDTNRVGTIRTGINPGGDLNTEWQFAAYDSFLEAAWRSTFPSDIAISATTIDAASGDNSFNDSGSGFGSVLSGQWIRVSGYSDPANNGHFRVTTATSAKLIVTGGTLVTEAVGPTVVIKGALMKNGTTQKSYTMERNAEDITEFISVTGMRVGEFNLSMGLRSIAAAGFTFIGKQATQAQATVMSGGFTTEVSNPKMNTIDDVKAIYIDGVISTDNFTQLDLAVTLNQEGLSAIGSLPFIDVDQRSIGVSGTLGLYYEDATFQDFSFDYTSFDLAFITEDSDGASYVIDMQNVNITGGSPDNPGIDQTITAPYTYEATYDSTFDATIGITKIPV